MCLFSQENGINAFLESNKLKYPLVILLALPQLFVAIKEFMQI